MATGSMLAVILSNLAAAQEPPELELWRGKLAIQVPETCRAIGEDGALRIDCGGSALLLEPASGEDPRQVALQRQLDVFSQAGISIPAPKAVSCSLSDAPSECLEVTLSIHGSSMILRSGATADWVATCLHRGTITLPAVCTSVFSN